MIKVLVVDDSALVRKLFAKVLAAGSEFEVAFARNGVEALACLPTFEPDVITLDINMPEMDGLTCLDRIMVERPCPVVMVSSLTAEGASATVEALGLGAVDFIAKPGGAVSLRMDEFAPALLQKVRAAAATKVKTSRRLLERVQHRFGVPVRKNKPSTPARGPLPSRANGKGLVLVGTSTGGPPALEALLAPLAASFPWPILIAQHMPAAFTGPLARRLSNICDISVIELAQPELLQPGVAYVGRGEADIVVSRGSKGLSAAPATPLPGYPWHPSTDRLVRTAMDNVEPERLIGILMTGMGNDGAEAMTKLHALGGKTIAEAEETAVVWGMPGELAKANGADWILPVHEIAQQLTQLVPADAARSHKA